MGIQNHNNYDYITYRASKAALNNFILSLSNFYKEKEITIASINPAGVRTKWVEIMQSFRLIKAQSNFLTLFVN